MEDIVPTHVGSPKSVVDDTEVLMGEAAGEPMDGVQGHDDGVVVTADGIVPADGVPSELDSQQIAKTLLISQFMELSGLGEIEAEFWLRKVDWDIAVRFRINDQSNCRKLFRCALPT
jgi:hypothetical protein